MSDSGPRKRAAAMREEQARSARRRRTVVTSSVVVAVLVVAVVIVVVATTGGGGGKTAATNSPPAPTTSAALLTGQPGPEGIVLESGKPLAPAATPADGKTVDGIQCNASEQVAYHIHTHLAMYIDGTLRPLPGGIGIVDPQAQETPEGPFFGATRCYYWLHVHAQDGVIHIESPTQSTYTLGQFFAEWGQPLSATQVGPAKGPVTAYVDGQPFNGNPADIRLASREDVQLDVGSPVVPFHRVDWSHSQL
ncbi:MAG TPA: hypothetical protein VHC43_05230 [Mycobacteriales bacterium]|nr:hypothetical protein [Mycobacteriales bacterium]